MSWTALATVQCFCGGNESVLTFQPYVLLLGPQGARVECELMSKVPGGCRWAQWLAGLDFLPQLPAGLYFQGTVSEEALQSALARYRRERRATHILATLIQRAEDSSELG